MEKHGNKLEEDGGGGVIDFPDRTEREQRIAPKMRQWFMDTVIARINPKDIITPNLAAKNKDIETAMGPVINRLVANFFDICEFQVDRYDMELGKKTDVNFKKRVEVALKKCQEQSVQKILFKHLPLFNNNDGKVELRKWAVLDAISQVSEILSQQKNEVIHIDDVYNEAGLSAPHRQDEK